MEEFGSFVLFVVEMFILAVCILQLRMSQEESRMRYFATLGVTIVGVLAAVLVVFFMVYPPPFGFTINAPITEIHACLVDGQYILEVPQSSDSSKPQIVMHNLKYDRNGTIFEIPVSVIDNSWEILGHRLKPYGKIVTMHIENAPKGFSASIQESPKATGIPPFDAIISFKIASNATLTHDTYYITIKGTGQDKAEGIYSILLKVGENCKQSNLWSMPLGSNNTITVGAIISSPSR